MIQRRGARPVAIVVALLASACGLAPARGDGGTLREWSRLGNYEIAVLTDPTPCVTGPVDFSVLLLDPATGGPIPETHVAVEVIPVGRPELAARGLATAEAATNKLLRAAVLDLRAAGRCEVTVVVDGPRGQTRVQFALDVADPSTPRPGILAWILWPLPIIALYAIHRRLVGRTDRSRRGTG
jgi:hypothetical protein